MSVEKLLKAAREVKEKAYAPYSHFHVGAALSTPSGKIYLGCNVENTSYGLTICAERNAIFQMVADGERQIAEILVIGDTEHFLPPCGACRQVIAEFADKDTVITMCNRQGQYIRAGLNDILPYAFFLEKQTTNEQ